MIMVLNTKATRESSLGPVLIYSTEVGEKYDIKLDIQVKSMTKNKTFSPTGLLLMYALKA